jgi:hypothetical protein
MSLQRPLTIRDAGTVRSTTTMRPWYQRLFASLEDEYWFSECESDAWLYAEKHGLLTVRK